MASVLRDAGVEGVVVVGDVQFTVQPKDPPQQTAPAASTDAPNALDDHSTYGLAPGSPLPGFPNPRKATP